MKAGQDFVPARGGACHDEVEADLVADAAQASDDGEAFAVGRVELEGVLRGGADFFFPKDRVLVVGILREELQALLEALDAAHHGECRWPC